MNHSPSFTTDAALDKEIKGTLIWDTLGLINFSATDRRKCLEEERRRIKDRLLGKYSKKETKSVLVHLYYNSSYNSLICILLWIKYFSLVKPVFNFCVHFAHACSHTYSHKIVAVLWPLCYIT